MQGLVEKVGLEKPGDTLLMALGILVHVALGLLVSKKVSAREGRQARSNAYMNT
jgi:hypothetical protein